VAKPKNAPPPLPRDWVQRKKNSIAKSKWRKYYLCFQFKEQGSLGVVQKNERQRFSPKLSFSGFISFK